MCHQHRELSSSELGQQIFKAQRCVCGTEIQHRPQLSFSSQVKKIVLLMTLKCCVCVSLGIPKGHERSSLKGMDSNKKTGQLRTVPSAKLCCSGLKPSSWIHFIHPSVCFLPLIQHQVAGATDSGEKPRHPSPLQVTASMTTRALKWSLHVTSPRTSKKAWISELPFGVYAQTTVGALTLVTCGRRTRKTLTPSCSVGGFFSPKPSRRLFNSGVKECSAPLQEFGSRAHAVCGEPNCI